MRARPLLAATLVVGFAGTARADLASETQAALVAYEAEAAQLDQNLEKPTRTVRAAEDLASRLVDAQVAFATGRFDEAALLLYDYIGQAQKPRDMDVALYYLAESLHQKGDRRGGRTYFEQLAKDHAGSKYYQKALQRLIEVGMVIRDVESAKQWLPAMDAIPAGQREPGIPYVRGKLASYQDQHDEALRWFADVPAGSEYELQARYFTGTVHIAKQDLAKATEIYDALLRESPRRTADRRVIELAQLALGRLYYERDQPSKAIDSYLLVDRRSDLFDEALYEVAWVYVKGKQFDKALRALELLALADPLSSKTPTVKILEGNLRIRKAQMVKARMDMGGRVEGLTPDQEYTKAEAIFTETHDTYVVPHDELKKIIDDRADPEQFVAQVTGRSPKTFAVNSAMPEIAAAWLREEPEVARVVAIETDLGEIQTNITDTERQIERIEAAMGSAQKVRLFPKLAEKRNRGTEIMEKLLRIQVQLLDEQRAAAGPAAAAADGLTEKRKQIAAEVAALPNAELDYRERIAAARAEYDKLDQQASETQVAIEAADATAAAIRKYLGDEGDKIAALAKAKLEKELAELGPEIAAMRAELEDIRNQIILGRDEAGTGDETAARARELRTRLREAIAAEQAALSNVATASEARQLATLSEKASAIARQIDGMTENIDRLVEDALADVRVQLAKEKAELNDYRKEFLTYEAQSRALAGTQLGSSFKTVKEKFYEVVIKSDVGLVDVSWSKKEDVDADLGKLNLMRQREVKQLRDEFRDLLEEEAMKTQTRPTPPPPPSGTDPAPAPTPAPTPDAGGTK
jgi:hypothetical protein